ncbi:hypothetical protein vseg_002323 [Gypsophila vaccaria]
MTKFSLFKEEEEEDDDDDDDEEIHMKSPPKRRRKTSNPPSTSASNNHDDDYEDDDDDDEDGEEDDSTERRSNRGGGGGGGMRVILSDPEVLDCFICFEPLSIPVFQCDNGHVVCSSCCNSLNNKCPSCSGTIGKNRCRAIEKVIESVKVHCCYIKNGCKETVSYCKKHEHEEKCIFAPCLCPVTDCLSRGSPEKLSDHMCREHSDLVVHFRYNSAFSVAMGKDENFLVLREEKDGFLFILSHGNTVSVKCMSSNSSDDGFIYDIVLRRGCSSLKFQSSTHPTIGQLSVPASVDYVMVPGYFYHTGGRLKMEICVWSKDGKARTCGEA